jgi:hypothetical protein
MPLTCCGKYNGVGERYNLFFSPVTSLNKTASQQKKLSVVAYTCYLNDGKRHKIGGLLSRSAWAKSKTLSPKNKSRKRWGMVHVVESLTSK